MVTSSNESQRWLSRAARLPAKLRDVAVRRAAGAAGLFVLALTAFGGCSSTGPKSSVDKFVGNWTFDSGTLNANCTGLPPLSNSLTGETLTLMKGTTSDLVSTLTSTLGTCTLNLTVNGTVASADPVGQTCNFTVPVLGQQVAVTIAVNTWTVTTADGLSMTTAATATGKGGLADGCPVTLNGAATKHAADGSAD